jgi:succinylglutamate desuccinylase
LGNDGFFLAPEVAPFWLWLSRVLRKAHVAELIHILPGVKKHPTEPGTFIVDTGIARLFPLQIFHLLGLRKQRWLNRQLVVSRRLYDTRGPFVRN